jgi:hypothetical protein
MYYILSKRAPHSFSVSMCRLVGGTQFPNATGGRRLVVKMCDIYWPEIWNLRVGYNHYY